MIDRTGTRDWNALTGLGFGVFVLAALAVADEPPKSDDAAADVVRYFADNRTTVLGSSALWFIAAILLLWFLGTLRSHIGYLDGVERLSATAYGAGIFGTAFLTAAFCASNAAALQISTFATEPLAVKAFYDLGGAFFAMSGIGFAVFYWATALAGLRSKSLPKWLCWLAVVAGAIQLLYAVSLMSIHGPLANGGSLGVLEPLFSLCWFLTASVVLLRKKGPGKTRKLFGPSA